MTQTSSVVVDGVEIPLALISQEAQHHPAASSADARAAAARALAARALLLKRAQQLELKAVPERDAQGREETEEEALIRTLLALEVDAEPASEERCRQFFAEHPERFKTPALYSASHILCAAEDESAAAWDEAERMAQKAVRRLQQGSKFGALAQELSACSSAKAGGQLGQMETGDLVPEVEQALGALEPGTWSDVPVRSRFGWHVLRLDQWVDGRALPFEHVEDQIRMYLDSRAWVLAASRYGRELAAEARASGVVLSLTPEGEPTAPVLTLGSFLGAGPDYWAAFESWLKKIDSDLATLVRDAADEKGCAFTELVQNEVLEFAQSSGDEGWTSLISAARNGADPLLECIRFVLRAKLAPPSPTRTIIGMSSGRAQANGG